MSTFKVSVEQINTVQEHKNADRLEIATLDGFGFQFIVPKGVFAPGDKAVYFPVDSLIPEQHIEKMGLSGKLSGKQKNRVKTIRLRGELAQGLIFLPHVLELPDEYPVGHDLTEHFGVTKFEAEARPTKGGNLVPLPSTVSKYDIESAQRYTSVVDTLIDRRVFITEKLEGSNWGVVFEKNDADGFDIQVIQRNFAIEPIEGHTHTWIKVAESMLGSLSRAVLSIALTWDAQVITFRGEIIGPGIQGNHYKLDKHEVCLFDIEIDGQPMDARAFVTICSENQLPIVPVLCSNAKLSDWLQGEALVKASTGKSQLVDKLREGIVIRPMEEDTHQLIGRLILKVRSPEYLEKSNL